MKSTQFVPPAFEQSLSGGARVGSRRGERRNNGQTAVGGPPVGLSEGRAKFGSGRLVADANYLEVLVRAGTRLGLKRSELSCAGKRRRPRAGGRAPLTRLDVGGRRFGWLEFSRRREGGRRRGLPRQQQPARPRPWRHQFGKGRAERHGRRCMCALVCAPAARCDRSATWRDH